MDASPPEIATTTPEDPAVPDSVMVPVLDPPPSTDVGETVKVSRVGTITVKEPLTDVEPREAVRVSIALAETAEVVTAKVPVEAPEAMKIELG
jgi:hypothetical protein